MRIYVDAYNDVLEATRSEDPKMRSYDSARIEAQSRADDAEISAAVNLLYADVMYKVSRLCVDYHEHPMTAKIIPLGNFLWGREVCRTIIEPGDDKHIVRLVSMNVDLHMEYHPAVYQDVEPWEEELVDIAKKFNKADELGGLAYLEIERVHDGAIVTLTPHKPKNLIR